MESQILRFAQDDTSAQGCFGVSSLIAVVFRDLCEPMAHGVACHERQPVFICRGCGAAAGAAQDDNISVGQLCGSTIVPP